jgi:cytochrome c oxidase subunit 2
VLFLFGFGTYELVQPGGAGGGQGASPIWTPASKTILPIQVIGQQWKFTYRYPTFGGFETNELVLPNNTSIQFNVTSLDVIHSFWAYQLGVKADANPDYNNVAFTTTQQLGKFTVRCAELCGLWHGAMFNYGVVVPKQQFESWATATEVRLRHNTALLPPYRLTYTPDANGADGGYYPDNVDPYSKAEQYGAPQGKGAG